MKDDTDPGSIVSRHEIAQILGVSRQALDGILAQKDFPPPIDRVGKRESPLFYRRAVEAYAKERRRTPA